MAEACGAVVAIDARRHSLINVQVVGVIFDGLAQQVAVRVCVNALDGRTHIRRLVGLIPGPYEPVVRYPARKGYVRV